MRHGLVFRDYKHGACRSPLCSFKRLTGSSYRPLSSLRTIHHLSKGTIIMSAVNLVTPRPSRPSTPQKPALAVDTFQSTKAPYNRLQRSRLTNMTTTTAVSPDLHAVNDLMSSMKATLHAIGKTFDSLGDQTARVADLGPALQATHQVSDEFNLPSWAR